MTPPIKKQTPEQRAIVDRANELRGLLNCKSDAEFVQSYLPFSQSRWLRIRNDQYNGDVDKSIDKLRQAVNTMEGILQRRMADHSGYDGHEDFYKLPITTSIENALIEARATIGQNRLVFVGMDTGGGKSATCKHLAATYNAVVINARPSWSKTGKPLCVEVCRALGEHGPWRSKYEAEEALLAAMRKNAGVLCIDEGNTLGSEAIDIIKLILNETQWSVVLFATKSLLTLMMRKSWYQASQLLRRSVSIISQPELTAPDVRPFVAGLEMTGFQKEACSRLATAGNQFGLYDFVARVARVLRDLEEDGPLTLEQVEKAIKDFQARLRVKEVAL